MKILIIGAGAREHTLAWAIGQSPLCTQVSMTPYNRALDVSDTHDIIGYNVAVDDVKGLVALAQDNHIDLVVVGPELPLTLGIIDALKMANILCFGPSKAAAMLEGSKIFMKNIARDYNIPTAKFAVCTTTQEALDIVDIWGAPIVIKADGLAAGKGVIIATTIDEAKQAIHDMMHDKIFGDAGAHIVLEECLEGQEISWFAISDNQDFVFCGCAQDHKRAFDGDIGPNTGGMGAYSFPNIWNEELNEKICTRITKPLLQAMASRDEPFQGFLFLGLMIDSNNDPYLIEINVRFGDPECSTLLPIIKSDFLTLLLSASQHQLAHVSCQFYDTRSIAVVIAAQGYPGDYDKNMLIMLPPHHDDDVIIFHAGTGLNAQGQLCSKGGRVLTIQAQGDNLLEARNKAYDLINMIHFPDSFYRHDIGHHELH